MQWYPWYPSKYESSTLHLNLEQDAIYRRLIDWYMTHEGDLSSNPQALAGICKISLEKWQEHSDIILKFWKQKNGRLSHRRCDLELRHQQNISQVRTKAAKTKSQNKNKSNDLPAIAKQNGSNCSAQTNKQTEQTDRTNKQANGHGHSMNGFGGSVGRFQMTDDTSEKLLSIARGWNQDSLVEKYNAWREGKEQPDHPQAAFLGWAQKFTKNQRPS